MGSYLGIHEVIMEDVTLDAGERRWQCLSVLTMGLPGKSHSYTFDSTISQVKRLHFLGFPWRSIALSLQGAWVQSWSGN